MYVFDPTKHQRDPSGNFSDIPGKGNDAPKTPSDECVLAHMQKMTRLPTIDLNARPTVVNEDGSVSTVCSLTIECDDGVFVIPTVVGDKVVSDETAIAYFQKTGEHLGSFDGIPDAEAYAQDLHLAQEKQYPAPPPAKDTKEPSKPVSSNPSPAPAPSSTPVVRRPSAPKVKKQKQKENPKARKAKLVVAAVTGHRISYRQAVKRLIKLGYSYREADQLLTGRIAESLNLDQDRLTNTQIMLMAWKDYP